MSGEPAPETRAVWSVTFLLFGLLAWTLVGGPFFVAFGIMDVLDGDGGGWWLIGPPAGILFLYLAWMLWYVPKALSCWSWELYKDHVCVKQGVFFRTEKRIPYARIQDVAIKQGPLRDWKDIYTLDIQTASLGSAVSAEGTMPGVRDAEAMAEAILAHVDRGD